MNDQAPVGGAEGAEDKTGFDESWEEGALEEAGQASKTDAPHDADDSHDHPEVDEDPDDSGQPGAEEDQERHEPDAGDSRPAGSETTDDVWANATPAQRAALTALEERAKRAENTLRSNNGRWSSAQRELDELRAKVAAQPAPGGDAAPGTGDGAAGGEPDELDAELSRVADEYSEILAAPLKKIADLESRIAMLSKDASRHAELEQAQADLAETERLAAEEQALATDHPDWGEQVQSQEFADWALSQPKMILDAIHRNGSAKGIVDGAEASKVLTLFKQETGIAAPGTGGGNPDPLAEQRARQLAGSQHIPTKAPAMEPRGKGSGSFDDEWDRAEAEEQRRPPKQARR